MNFDKQLKKHNKTLWQVNKFIIDAEKLGYGEVVLTIKTHNYLTKIIEMTAKKAKKATIRKSVTKRIMPLGGHLVG